MTNSRIEALGHPLGFPKCPWCAYLRHGQPDTCITCVEQSVGQSTSAMSCPTCGNALVDGQCKHATCPRSSQRIGQVHAIVHDAETMRATIARYRDDQRLDWAVIFGRLVIGWLDQHVRSDPPDIIVASPTFVRHERPFRYVETVLDAAAAEDVLGEWPIDIGDPRALTTTAEIPNSANDLSHRISAKKLYRSLRIASPSTFAGKHVLVFDIESSTGEVLNTIAAFLLERGGAEHVEGLVLVDSPLVRSTHTSNTQHL